MHTYVSFFLDDVAPYVSGKGGRLVPIDASALIEVLDYIKQNGLAGAISVIPGMFGKLLTRPQNEHERRFAEAMGRLSEYPVDPHMEIMTHERLFDFSKMRLSDGPTEMEWLDDPSVSVDEYRGYFLNTIKVGRELGIRYTGVSTPGTHPKMNPNVYRALLELSEAGEFPNAVVPVFGTIEEGHLTMTPRPREVKGDFGVYDMPSGVWDYLASWRNSPDWVDVDRYVDEKGEGHLARMIKAGSFMALFHMHWQGLNPRTGLGWEAFQMLIEGVRSQFGERVLWRRPSEIAYEFYRKGGWELEGGLQS